MVVKNIQAWRLIFLLEWVSPLVWLMALVHLLALPGDFPWPKLGWMANGGGKGGRLGWILDGFLMFFVGVFILWSCFFCVDLYWIHDLVAL